MLRQEIRVREQPNDQAAPAVKRNTIVRHKKQIIVSVSVVIALIASSGIAFYSGIQIGKKEAAKQINTKIGQFLNPLNALSSNPLFPNSVIGKVSTVNPKSITVKLINGKIETIQVSDKTLITQQTKTLKPSELKKDANVTVFTAKTTNKKDLVASRIIVRS